MTDQEEKDPHQFFTKARRDKTRQKPINKTKIKQSIHYSIQQNISINFKNFPSAKYKKMKSYLSLWLFTERIPNVSTCRLKII